MTTLPPSFTPDADDTQAWQGFLQSAGLRAERLDAGFGVRLHGVDSRQPTTPAQVLAIRAALRAFRIVVFPGQQAGDAQFLQFSLRFGPIFQPPRGIPVLGTGEMGDTPDVVLVSNVDDGVLGNAELTAHSDHHWTPQPSSGSLLYALEVPAEGGDTTWYDLVAAYEGLDAQTRAEIDTLQLITYNPFERRKHPVAGGIPPYRTPDIEPLPTAVPHPLVRTHPENGRRLIYLGERTEVEIVGHPPVAGAALIARLRRHILQPRFAYTHRWQVGDIVFWDNQATLHARTAFDPQQRRVLKRVSLAGSTPF